MISLAEDNTMLGYGLLSACSNISHFVTTRHGGCSKGNYGSFNCSPYTGDEPEHVRRNQSLLLRHIPHPVRELVIPRQNHGVVCRLVTSDYPAFSPLRRQSFLEGVDALMTDQPGLCLCVTTADCVPLLLYDRRHRAVAAVHAGWKGTVRRIVRLALEQMNAHFCTSGEDLIACIGPSISLDSFEVGEEVYEMFRQQGFDMPRISFWRHETAKHHIDLWEANRIQLLEFGIPVAQIETAGICTYRRCEDFFSARRLGINSGRILSGIMLNE